MRTVWITTEMACAEKEGEGEIQWIVHWAIMPESMSHVLDKWWYIQLFVLHSYIQKLEKKLKNGGYVDNGFPRKSQTFEDRRDCKSHQKISNFLLCLKIIFEIYHMTLREKRNYWIIASLAEMRLFVKYSNSVIAVKMSPMFWWFSIVKDRERRAEMAAS